MDRIISDAYIKGEKMIYGDDPSEEMNQKILAINDMYGWLYNQGILEKVSFVFLDYPEGTHFALDVKDLYAYRSAMENSGVPGASLAVYGIFDEAISPCMYSGAIEPSVSMATYREVDGCVGRSWECSLIQALDTKGIYDVLAMKESCGTEAAVKAMYGKFKWNPTLNERKTPVDDLLNSASSTEKRTQKLMPKRKVKSPER